MDVAKSGLYIFSANILSMFIGYLFWILLSKLTGSQAAEMIGYVSSAVAFSTVISTISLLGIPLAVQRFIGKAYAEKKLGRGLDWQIIQGDARHLSQLLQERASSRITNPATWIRLDSASAATTP